MSVMMNLSEKRILLVMIYENFERPKQRNRNNMLIQVLTESNPEKNHEF